MKKNVTNDILPSKKSIRDIELPSRVKDGHERKTPKYAPKDDPFTRPVAINNSSVSHDPVKIDSHVKTPIPPTHDNFGYKYGESKKSGKKFFYIIAGCIILVLVFVFSSIFNSAVVTITPQQSTKDVNDTFTAKKDLTSSSLGFQLVTVTKDMERAIDPKDITAEQKVERKAKGTVVLYNNFGSEAQKLVATTRLQTPEGLIYRLVSAVTIPGRTTKEGKLVPGSVEAEVVADKAGANYNIGLKDFTVPGLKTDPAKYKTIYARSKTEMIGGFSGMEKVVSKEVLAKVESELETSIRSNLSKDISIQIPAEYILFPESLTFKFDPAITATSQTGGPVVKKKGVAMAVMFEKKSLTRAIVTKVLPDTNPDLVKILNIDNFEFSLSSSTQIGTTNNIIFSLKGGANIVWTIDEAKLKNDLLGLSKSNANAVMASYPSVKEAWVLTKPFWNTKIPRDAKKVTIVNTVVE